MVFGGKQPRFAGKQPRFPSKQPRRAQITDTDSENEGGEAAASDEGGRGGDEDEDYEEEEEEEEEEAVDRWGFLKSTSYDKKPGYFSSRKIHELLALLPAAEAEAVEQLTGLKRDARMGEVIEKYTEAFEYHVMKAQMEQEQQGDSAAKRDARKPRAQKEKDKKKGALQELMESKRASERATRPQRKRGRADIVDGDMDDDESEDEDMDMASDGADEDDGDEDYEEGKSRRLTRRSKARAAKGSAVPAALDEDEKEIMAGLDSDDEDDDDDDDEGGRYDYDADDAGFEGDDDGLLEQEEATLDDLNRARLTRVLLAKYVHEPFFEQMVTGAFVRVPIGQVGGRNTYRVACVDSVGEYKRMYKVEDGKGRHVATRKILRVISPGGGATRDVDMSRISNHRISEAEYADFKQVLQDKNAARVGPNQCRRIAERIVNLPRNYKYKAEDVLRITEARGVEMGGATSHRRLDAVDKDLESSKLRLGEAKAVLEKAEAAFEDAEQHEIGGAGPAERQNLEQAKEGVTAAKKDMSEKLARRAQLLAQTDARRADAARRDNGMFRINKRNENKNRNGILASGDRKRRGSNAFAAPDAASATELNFGFAPKPEDAHALLTRKPKKPKFDPFQRRQTRPSILWKTHDDEVPTSAAGAEEAKDTEGGAPTIEEQKAEPLGFEEEKSHAATLEELMCKAMTPEDLNRFDEVNPDGQDATLHAAALALGLPWPLPLTERPAAPAETPEAPEPLVQPSHYLIMELTAAERYLLQRRRVYRAVKMHLNLSRWSAALRLALEHPKYIDLVLARRMAFLEKTGRLEHNAAYLRLAGRGANLDIDELKKMSLAFEEEDKKLDERQRKQQAEERDASHAFMLYTLEEYHARREEQFTDQ